jgi:hypothetical protein
MRLKRYQLTPGPVPEPHCSEIIFTTGEEFHVTPERCRLARALLGWTRQRLSTECQAVADRWRVGGVSAWAIKDFEETGETHRHERRVLEETLAAYVRFPVVPHELGVILRGFELDRRDGFQIEYSRT